MNKKHISKILVLFGTRPEAIKMAPVIHELRNRGGSFDCRVCSTGQHREMVDQALEAFDLAVDIQLDAMSSAKSLSLLTSRLFADIDHVLATENPDWLLVQGDTTSAMVGGVGAFYRQVRVGHVEAGLRTFNPTSPFPEEINRTFIGHVATLHFAPTPRAAANLRRAGVAENRIVMTGNTIVDALIQAGAKLAGPPPALPPDLLESMKDRRLVLVTSHRRESFGRGLEEICRALSQIALRHPDAFIVYPVHLNPQVREPVYRLLGDHPSIRLIAPQPYLSMLYLISRSYLILSDSGGIQEEAPSYGKPILILRDTTERPEVVEAGCGRLVGAECENIVRHADELLSDRSAYALMTGRPNPFGDGQAAGRIAGALAAHPKNASGTNVDAGIYSASTADYARV